jgi:hypothetical protein
MASDPGAGLTGAAFELASAGYRPMPEKNKKPDEEAIGSESASLREAAERRPGLPDKIVVREYLDGNGKPVAANEAVTLARAGRDYAEAAAADRAAAERETAAELAAHADALRAEGPGRDPDATELHGLDPLEAATEATDVDKPAPEEPDSDPALDDGDAATGLDPELQKALEHPQVRHAIEQKIGEAEKTRQDYLNGLAAATQIAQVSFLSQFPELAAVAPENMSGVLAQMSRQDPAKFARVQAMVATTEQLFAGQRQESRRQAETNRQGFQDFAKSEDARFEAMLKGEAPETRRAVSAEIIASAGASGVDATELMRLFDSEPVMRNAAFQRMMYDAGKYRLMMKAKDAVATRPVPPVQRPGMARAPAERERADLRTLSARLSNSGNIRDAVALYHARKSQPR